MSRTGVHHPGSAGLIKPRTMVPILVLWTCLFLDSTQGFNFDLRAPVVFAGQQEGSLFGFSVAQHRDGNTDWVLVGAPEESMNADSGGAVYRCPVAPINNPGPCIPIPFDTAGVVPSYDKSNQWFGASVASSGADGRIVACAPRLVWLKALTATSTLEREPVGTCFVGMSDFSSFEQFTPCQKDADEFFGFDKVSHCQAGFSAKLQKDNEVLIMGAPGSYYLQGQVYAQNVSNKSDVRFTQEAAASFDNSYRGFSMALGDFNGDGQEDYVVGTPRGESLSGLVAIFDKDLNMLSSVIGEQLVSYFGNSVEAVDVNNDDLDDLIVGAPMHTDRGPAIEKWEAGQVYVYLQQADHSFSDPQTLTGQTIRARFGYSVAAIGDANQDGFNDVAIGAPFDGEGQTGLVYIYHGSADGLRSQYSQVISPTDLGLTGVTTFGFSIVGGQDMDGNNYPDLVVGAESADRAILVRTRPVVLLQADLTLDPIGINLDNKTFQLPDGPWVTTFSAIACFSYTGKHLPTKIAITYTVTLDSRITSSPRALLVQNTMSRIEKNRNLDVGNQFCDTLEAYVVNSIQDKLAPIAVTLNYELNQDESTLQSHEILPIINKEAVSSQTKQVYIQNNCQNNICIPELGVSATSNVAEIVIGKTGELTLQVTIANEGEDAFQSTLLVYYPKGLQFVRLERRGQTDLSVACSEDTNTRIISCDTGNPLAGRYTLDFGLTMSTYQVNGDNENIEFYLKASSENPEVPEMLANNELNMTVGVTVDLNLKLLSASDPEIVTYPLLEEGEVVPPFPSNASETDIGPAIMHLYEVRNAGPSTAGLIEMSINWPQKNDNGEYLFYLLGLNTAEGINCEVTQGSINPEGVRLLESTRVQLSNTSSLTSLSPDGRRRRRQSTEPEALPQVDPILCAEDTCVKIMCSVDELQATESKVVRLLGRFWRRTFQKPGAAQKIQVSVASTASATVLSVPYNIPLPREFTDSTKASTTISEEELQLPPVTIAWWIIVVSVLGGIILLLIIILGLWKCGFFERKKPGEDQKDYEPVPVNEKSDPDSPADV